MGAPECRRVRPWERSVVPGEAVVMAQERLQPGQVFAGYSIQRLLGVGGMGAVYLARHPNLPKLVALKLLTRVMTDDDDVRARFLPEADHVARLDHPNIVAVYDRGDQDGQLWIAMRYIDGSDAATARREGPLPAARTVAQVNSDQTKAGADAVSSPDTRPGRPCLAHGHMVGTVRCSIRLGCAPAVHVAVGHVALRNAQPLRRRTGVAT
jgi:hypothetical protein